MNEKTALLVIDPQNDYFPGGKFPLWNADNCRKNVIKAIHTAQKAAMPVILIQHVASGNMAPFFLAGTPGVEIDAEVRAAAPEARIVVKHFADGFHRTELEATLQQLGVTKLLICGMMTQNCVTFTALSKSAEKYNPEILADCCTTVSEMLHLIALNALATRVELTGLDHMLRFHNAVEIMTPGEVLKKFVELFNRADASALAELYAEDAINHQVANEPVSGKAAIREMFEKEFAAAEMVCIVENIFEDGEWSIMEWRDPKGMRGCGFFHVVNGKIALQRGYWDKLSFLKQQNPEAHPHTSVSQK